MSSRGAAGDVVICCIASDFTSINPLLHFPAINVKIGRMRMAYISFVGGCNVFIKKALSSNLVGRIS